MKRADHRPVLHKHWWLLLLVMLGFGGLLAAAEKAFESSASHRRDADVPAAVNHPRVCAAVATYTIATRDYWYQRAAIARATLNRFLAIGHVPDCRQALGRILTDGLDPYLWQSSLDAVDAVQSGDYVLPLACARADTIRRFPRLGLLSLASLRAPAVRTPCVINDLEFTEEL